MELGEATRWPPRPSEVEVILAQIVTLLKHHFGTQKHDVSRIGGARLVRGRPDSQLVRVRNSLSRLITGSGGPPVP